MPVSRFTVTFSTLLSPRQAGLGLNSPAIVGHQQNIAACCALDAQPIDRHVGTAAENVDDGIVTPPSMLSLPAAAVQRVIAGTTEGRIGIAAIDERVVAGPVVEQVAELLPMKGVSVGATGDVLDR